MNNETTERLRTKLTDGEVLKYARESAGLQSNIAENESQLAALQKEFKARIASMESRRDELATKIDTGHEYREVVCRWEYDWTAGDKTLYRQDTFESVRAVKITAEERQQKLPIDDKECK